MKKSFANLRLLFILLAFVMLAGLGSMGVFSEEIPIWDGTVSTAFGGGSGSENDPYLIYNGAQLAYLAQTLNSGTNYDGVNFKLMNDIVLNDTSDWETWDTTPPKNTWTAIGTQEYNFRGSFDGDFHEISGIYIYDTSYQGLFGYAYKSTIKNVGVVKSYFACGNYTGAVLGYNYYDGVVSNCYSSATINNKGSKTIGGVVGYNRGTIKNVYNTGNVSSMQGVGGIVGENYGTVTDSYNFGTISGSLQVGGVVGSSMKDIISCYNVGNVSCTGRNVGNIVGYVATSNTITQDCYYLSGCATDGNGVLQYGVGNKTKGSVTEDVSGKTTGLTRSEMLLQGTFAGFDFENVWGIDSTQNCGYPYLLSNPPSNSTHESSLGIRLVSDNHAYIYCDRCGGWFDVVGTKVDAFEKAVASFSMEIPTAVYIAGYDNTGRLVSVTQAPTGSYTFPTQIDESILYYKLIFLTENLKPIRNYIPIVLKK